MRKIVMVSLVLFAACGGGGGKKTEDTTPEGDDDTAVDEGGEEEEMIPPERMDEITRALERKQNTAGTRCLERAIDNGELKKNARGSIQYNFVITAAGKATELEVVKNSFEESPMFLECMNELMTGIDFGALPRDLPWSYKFKYEAF